MFSQKVIASVASSSGKQISAEVSLLVHLLLQISGWSFAFQTHCSDGYKKSHLLSVCPTVSGSHNERDSFLDLYMQSLKPEVLSCFSSRTVLLLEDMTIQQNPRESVLILQFSASGASTYYIHLPSFCMLKHMPQGAVQLVPQLEAVAFLSLSLASISC